MTRIYVAGPMAGHPDLSRATFARAADALRDSGHDVVNPHDIAPWTHDGPCPTSYSSNDGHSAACYLRTCLREMLLCDLVVFLPGWESSVGERTEMMAAAPSGLRVAFANERGVVSR